MSKRHPSALVSFLYDLGVVAALAAVIWFFLGHFLQASYFETGYQDFIAHAYRIEEIERHGISSWSFNWGNGLAFWRAYQYIPNMMTLAVKHFFVISTIRAMLLTLTLISYFYAITSYIYLRKLNVHRLSAFFSILLVFTATQFYISLMDYSIYFSYLFIPTIIFLFICDIKSQRHSLSLPMMAGLSWLIHPILGYTSTFLWLWTFTPQLESKNIRAIVSRSLFFLIGFSAFLIPYITNGYSYSNP
jgi:hypothetical protein